ncbi:MAG: cysteine-rich small domain-containing protein [Defluviitaleaceae bacterium]|nr:cysteine-rich small domain-containing protein [Defluviitaleaceae bacterium]
MENNYKFFNNHACEYFPCHEKPNSSEFNCLFCYCPLYALGENCGGIFEYIQGIKSCTDCYLPHMPDYYDTIVSILSTQIKG